MYIGCTQGVPFRVYNGGYTREEKKVYNGGYTREEKRVITRRVLSLSSGVKRGTTMRVLSLSSGVKK